MMANMKRNIYSLHIRLFFAMIFALISALQHASGQPNPTIINGNVILCPGEQETLMTQVYDSYQWYKDGAIIQGAVFQTHVVTYYNDAGSSFSVFVTQGGQSAMSPSIIVDGYMFLPLTVSNYGQGFWFTGNGWEMCEYHELYFEVMMPYNTNIQWYKNGIPIFGANSTVYSVQQTGVYTVSAAPQICPNYIQYSLDLPVVVHTPPTPVITQSADTLITSVYPGQWYAGENPIPGATGQFYIPEAAGWYSFEFTDPHGCKKMSEAYYYEWDPLGLPFEDSDRRPQVIVKNDQLTIHFVPETEFRIFSITGALVLHGITGFTPVDISSLGKGLYFIHFSGSESNYVLKFVR